MRLFILFIAGGLLCYGLSLIALLRWEKYPRTQTSPRAMDVARLVVTLLLLVWASALLFGGAA